jgi:hypothetical protein
MMTVWQIERLWTAQSYEKLAEVLLQNRWEGAFGQRVRSGSAIVAAALALIRLDELGQSDAPVFGKLVRTLVATQECDGGWGDVAATTWALRALLINNGSGAAVDRGMAYLAGLQKSEGIWPNIPIRRTPADPFISAFILFQLAESGEFRRRVRFADAVDWFRGNCRHLDIDSRGMWERAQLRCRPAALPGYARMDVKAGDGIRTHDVSLGKAAFYH